MTYCHTTTKGSSYGKATRYFVKIIKVLELGNTNSFTMFRKKNLKKICKTCITFCNTGHTICNRNKLSDDLKKKGSAKE